MFRFFPYLTTNFNVNTLTKVLIYHSVYAASKKRGVPFGVHFGQWRSWLAYKSGGLGVPGSSPGCPMIFEESLTHNLNSRNR